MGQIRGFILGMVLMLLPFVAGAPSGWADGPFEAIRPAPLSKGQTAGGSHGAGLRLVPFYLLPVQERPLANFEQARIGRWSLHLNAWRLGRPVADHESELLGTGYGRTGRDTGDWAWLHFSGFQIAPSYQQFQYLNFYQPHAREANRFRFITADNETLEVAGSDIVWRGAGPVKAGVRGRRYTYELRREEAYYMAGFLTIDMAGGNSVGLEAGRMDGGTPENHHHLYSGYVHWRNPLRLKGFLRMESRYTVYDEPVSGRGDGMQVALSAGRAFWKERVEVQLSGSYCRDPFAGDALGAAVIFHVRR